MLFKMTEYYKDLLVANGEMEFTSTMEAKEYLESVGFGDLNRGGRNLPTLMKKIREETLELDELDPAYAREKMTKGLVIKGADINMAALYKEACEAGVITVDEIADGSGKAKAIAWKRAGGSALHNEVNTATIPRARPFEEQLSQAQYSGEDQKLIDEFAKYDTTRKAEEKAALSGMPHSVVNK